MMAIATSISRTTNRRRGSAYLLVLSSAMIVTVIGLSALIVARVNTRMVARSADAREAQVLAMTAVEQALTIIGEVPTWRAGFTHDTPTTEITFGRGFVSMKFEDMSGDDNLGAGDDDPVRVHGIGRVGESVRIHSVVVAPAGSGLDCLASAAHAGNDLIFDAVTLTGTNAVSANDVVTASGAEIHVDVNAVGTISGANYHGNHNSGMPPRTMPDPGTVFDYYTVNGTWISIADIPLDGLGFRGINRKLISPVHNPFGGGTTNPQGIYIIDCQGQKWSIQKSRIHGTLVLLNPGAGSRIDKEVLMDPAVPMYPILLVDGSISIDLLASVPLTEFLAGTNLNPPGVPYQGQVDLDTTDTYPTLLQGLIYASGDITTNNSPRINGVVVVGNTMNANGLTLDLIYNSLFLNAPPPGFGGGTGALAATPGSWRWETAD